MLSVPKIHLPKRDEGVPIGGLDKEKWFRTGDLGQLDRSGKLTITGREDDLVKVDGKRLALGEVEGCLESFPKVKAAQARVITDDLGGPMVVARGARRHLQGRRHHRPLRAQPGALQGPAPDRILRSESEGGVGRSLLDDSSRSWALTRVWEPAVSSTSWKNE